jgi:hypothetical protein
VGQFYLPSGSRQAKVFRPVVDISFGSSVSGRFLGFQNYFLNFQVYIKNGAAIAQSPIHHIGWLEWM